MLDYASTYLQDCFTRHIPVTDVQVIFELGARDGADSVMLQQHYRPRQMIAFECNPDAVMLCRHNLAAYPDIRLVEQAVWDQDGELSFYSVRHSYVGEARGNNIGASSCFPDAGTFSQRLSQEKVTVPATRIDSFCATAGIERIDLVCMDVQGAHLHALRGFGEMLKTVRYIISEIETTPLYVGQPTLPETCSFLYDNGFRMLAVDMQCKEFGDFLFARV